MNAPHDPIAQGDLYHRAGLAGIALNYASFWGENRDVPPEVLERALAAMGPHADASALPPPVLVEEGRAATVDWTASAAWRLVTSEVEAEATVCEGRGPVAQLPAGLRAGYYRLVAADADAGTTALAGSGAHAAPERFVIVAPAQCWSPEPLRHGERWWGLCVQLYSLRSERNWGIGDFTDLSELVATAAAQGAAFIGLSPLHALRMDRADLASPYSPSSRLALNPLFIDVTAMPEFLRSAPAQALYADGAFQQRLEALRAADTVQYADVSAAKEEMLALLWEEFRQGDWKTLSPRGVAFQAFLQEHDATLGQHALYEALQRHLSRGSPDVWGWPAWPEALRDPRGAEVQAFAREHAEAVAYHMWLQWTARTQLDQAGDRARALMPVGLYCDLAVGASDGGSETWTLQDLYARGMNVGAPPDPLNTQGQDWGLPPLNPVALSAARFMPIRRLLHAVMHPAGALRMDHVMALMRLFWIHNGAGTYVAYPLEALLAVLAIESHRHRCLVIGEDLGNVAPRMREAMAQRAVLSYRPLIFERLDGGAFRPPAQWPAQALAVVSTHDLPTLRGYWSGEDIEVQKRLGWLPDSEAHARSLIERAQDRVRLLMALQEEGLLPEGATVDAQSVPEATPEFIAAVHGYLARTPCWLAAVQIEDAIGQLEQVNVPGTTEDMQPNWRRRLAVPLDRLATHPCFAAVASAMRAQRGRPAFQAEAEALPALDTADVPLATYRVQFHKDNTFEAMTRAVPYLHALGISHLYSSPYLKAAPGSTHGYNVVDPTQLNPEIGDDTTHAALCDALKEHGLGQLLDIVPNHMGVLDAPNPWWDDVMEHGRASAYAGFFDIEWEPATHSLQGRVLLPMLGGQYGRVLEAGELRLDFDAEAGKFLVRYWDHRLPVDPRHYARIFAAVPAPATHAESDGDSALQVQSLVDAFGRLPDRDTSDDAERAMRLRDAPLHQRRLAELAAAHAWLRQWIDACLQHWNGRKEEPASLDALDALLRDQPYRLADWRVAGDDINYRRFFDVNSLAALRMEEPGVFEAAHACIFRWLAEGRITGLRIDHPDGLAHPAQYFDRLQRRYVALARAAGREPTALYLVVEKILADHEPLPAEWPVHGATGYRFSSLVNGLFVDAASQSAFDDVYTSFTGDTKDFEEAVYECKKHIIGTSLYSDLGWLTDTLYRIAQADRRTFDFTRNQLRNALTEVAAVFPVYRTYLVPDGTPASDADRQHVGWAVAAARRRMGTSEGGVLAFLQGVLLGDEGPVPELRARFLRRWQQFTSPVMAKSLEDTVFYRYVRLVSLNDVGSEPRRFGLTASAFHQANLQRARYRPHNLLATSTHDSKRSEDLRARLNVLSEIPALWEDTALQLRELGERFASEVDGDTAPRAHDLWALYQALVGIWPTHATQPDERQELRERIQQYMVKAMREAKQQTNWLFPNEAYENAVARYIDGALSTERFVRELERFVQSIAPYGYRNSLCQLALKLTVPGVPDIYQGCEQWNFSLVDPDNRRPVDFPALAQALEGLQTLYQSGHPSQADWERLLGPVPSPDAKQLVTWRLLQLRQALPDLFFQSTYLPLALEGASAEHAFAFARIRDGKAIVVVCSRLPYGLAAAGWRGTRVAIASAHPQLAKTAQWEDWMTGRRLGADTGEGWDLDEVLGEMLPDRPTLPFAVLVGAESVA